MILTLQQVFNAVTEYTAGPGCEISTDELAIYKEIVTDELNRLNPGFSGNALLRLEAYLIADLIECKDPDTEIQSEQIGDHRWTFAQSKTSSRWMDKALAMIPNYKPEFGGVERSDSRMSSMATDQIRPEEYGTVDEPCIDGNWNQDYDT